MKGKVVDTKVLLPWAKDEMMLPTAEGKLGPKTLEAWEGQKGEVLKGFEELIGLLKEDKVAEEIAA